jgi:8-oxo-dGTP pyrophosphatase MutT (NUDIX family)
MSPSRLATEFSYGIIPYKLSNQTFLFLLIQHRKGHWGFPKGHAENNETAAAAACREFSEETGINDFRFYQEPVFTENYLTIKKGQTYNKMVSYFLGEVFSEKLYVQEEEVIGFQWNGYEGSMDLITHKESREILIAANDFLTHQYPLLK